MMFFFFFCVSCLVSENLSKSPGVFKQTQAVKPQQPWHPTASRQILRIKSGAAALESPSFEQLEAQKLALSEHEARGARGAAEGAISIFGARDVYGEAF